MSPQIETLFSSFLIYTPFTFLPVLMNLFSFFLHKVLILHTDGEFTSWPCHYRSLCRSEWSWQSCCSLGIFSYPSCRNSMLLWIWGDLSDCLDKGCGRGGMWDFKAGISKGDMASTWHTTKLWGIPPPKKDHIGTPAHSPTKATWNGEQEFGWGWLHSPALCTHTDGAEKLSWWTIPAQSCTRADSWAKLVLLLLCVVSLNPLQHHLRQLSLYTFTKKGEISKADSYTVNWDLNPKPLLLSLWDPSLPHCLSLLDRYLGPLPPLRYKCCQGK